MHSLVCSGAEGRQGAVIDAAPTALSPSSRLTDRQGLTGDEGREGGRKREARVEGMGRDKRPPCIAVRRGVTYMEGDTPPPPMSTMAVFLTRTLMASPLFFLWRVSDI